MVKLLILGAGGIVGQHMRLCVPSGVEAVFARRTADRYVNEQLPEYLADACEAIGARLIHISSQAARDPVNEYGRQKLAAEVALRAAT